MNGRPRGSSIRRPAPRWPSSKKRSPRSVTRSGSRSGKSGWPEYGPREERMTNSNGNAADYFIDRHLREGRGDRLAFVDPWRSLTYAQLADAAARVAAGLRGPGIERERRLR